MPNKIFPSLFFVPAVFGDGLPAIGLDTNNITIRQIGSEGVEKLIAVEALNQPVVFPGESVFAWEIDRSMP